MSTGFDNFKRYEWLQSRQINFKDINEKMVYLKRIFYFYQRRGH